MVAVLLLAAVQGVFASASHVESWQEDAPLILARDIRELSPESANKKRRVQLLGVVTHANPDIGDFFIQDHSSAIYVSPQKLNKTLVPGDQVEVTGVTKSGDFAPCVTAQSVKKVGTVALPDPLPYDLNLEDSRWLDAQYVQCWTIVENVNTTTNGYTLLQVSSLKGKAYVLIPGKEHAARFQNLQQASIRFRAVCVPSFNKKRVIAGPPRLFVQKPDDIIVLQRMPTHFFDTPTKPIESLYRYSPDPHPGSRRVKVSGLVLGTWKETVYIEDQTDRMIIHRKSAENLQPGTTLEAVGLVAVEQQTLVMRDAVLHVTGKQVSPQPQVSTASEVLVNPAPCRLVSITARVVEIATRQDHHEITLQGGATTFEAFAPLSVNVGALAPHCRVSVTGIYSALVPPDPSRQETRFTLLLREQDDLQFLEAPPSPPWWATTQFIVGLGVVAAIGLLAITWGTSLRYRVRQQTEEIHRHFAKEAQLETQLLQSQKLEAIGRLAGGIAHDFNNLLTVINGCGELLANQLSPATAEQQLAIDIARAGQKAATLTKQLMLFSRHRSVPLGPVDLNAVVQETGLLLQRVIGEHIELIIHTEENLQKIHAETGLIHQIILNLALNSRDAMPEQGKLSISTKLAPNDRVRLIVQDTGHGMDSGVKCRIFEPFFTTKDVGKGVGLGLATVYGIVQTLGGDIRCESQLNQGTRFEVDFVCAPEHICLPAPSSSIVTPSVTPRLSATIILVEDEQDVRELVRTVLSSAGYHVLTANDPNDALELIASHQNKIDLLVTDIVMPIMNGRQLADKMKTSCSSLKVLFMSGYTPEDVLQHKADEQPAAFLQKPFTPKVLLAKVHEMLNTSKPKEAEQAKYKSLQSGSFQENGEKDRFIVVTL